MGKTPILFSAFSVCPLMIGFSPHGWSHSPASASSSALSGLPGLPGPSQVPALPVV
jgi:hypothetical protein